MNWLRLIQELLPIIVKVVEAVHGKGNGPAKRAFAIRMVDTNLTTMGYHVDDKELGIEVDKTVADLKAKGQLV